MSAQDTTAKPQAAAWIKWVALGLLLLSGLIIHLVRPDFFATVWQLSLSGDINGTLDFLRSFGVWAMVVSVVVDVLINAVGFLPSIFISTANGILFGIISGVIISWLAECIGVIISFILMRGLLRSYAEKLIQSSNWLQKLDELSGANGLKVMAIARSMPYFPSGVITALGALSSISLRDYIIANFIGKFPSTALEVVIGHDLVTYKENLNRLALTVVAVVVVYAGIWWYQKRAKARREKQPE